MMTIIPLVAFAIELGERRKEAMRLVTQNLMCCVKCQAYPLSVEATELALMEATYDADFVRRMLARIEYSYLLQSFAELKACQKDFMSSARDLPADIEQVDLSNDSSEELKAIFYAMSVVAVKNGKLVCKQCATEYPITEFIPNMMPGN